MDTTFIELCQKTKLSKSERLMADYIINNFESVRLMTSVEVADAVNSSHSSVIRFAKDLGFEGYTDMRNYIRQEFEKSRSEFDVMSVIPSEKLKLSMSKLSRDDLIDVYFEQMIVNIKKTQQMNTRKVLSEASHSLIKSNMKYIVGYRAATSIASLLSIILRDMIPNVFSCDSVALAYADFLIDVKKTDTVIVIGFPRYNKQTIYAAEQAHQAGANIIAITDSVTSPLAKYADHLLLAAIDSAIFANSFTASMCIAELLSTFVAKEIGKENETRLDIINEHISKLEIY